MATAKKPQIQKHIFIEKRIVGAIMLDDAGYFYRPKYNSISTAAYNSKKDGAHFASLSACERSVLGLDE